MDGKRSEESEGYIRIELGLNSEPKDSAGMNSWNEKYHIGILRDIQGMDCAN